MRYTIKMTANNRPYGNEIHTDDLNKALRIKRMNNVRLVGVKTTITDNITGREVITKNNYYGETKVYGRYIKGY